MTKALITGIHGQDGSYLAEYLLSLGYEVHGISRRTVNNEFANLKNVIDKVTIHSADLIDQASLTRVVGDVKPDEVYNLAAQSFVKASWAESESTGQITGLGVLRMLEAIRIAHPQAKFYQASSSELFGLVRETPQKETTPFYPRSPYGVAKAYAHYITVNYRESYKLFAACGILMNHESERRGKEFVTRKISYAAARIKLGLQDKLRLGNLDAKRDWGFAGDYVRAMYLMLQHDRPDDFVIATGEMHSVREFCEIAFRHLGLDYNDYVVVDPEFYRPAEVDILCGDASKARKILGWVPEVSFEQLVKMMVDADLELVRSENKLSIG